MVNGHKKSLRGAFAPLERRPVQLSDRALELVMVWPTEFARATGKKGLIAPLNAQARALGIGGQNRGDDIVSGDSYAVFLNLGAICQRLGGA